MPRLSVWFIRASLIYLAAGFTFGGILLFNKGIPLVPSFWLLLPAHIELTLFGWIVQLVIGVAFWILPRFSRGPKRGNELLGWISFVLINLGLLLIGFAPLLNLPAPLSFLGHAMEVAAALFFLLHAWPRIKAAGE